MAAGLETWTQPQGGLFYSNAGNYGRILGVDTFWGSGVSGSFTDARLTQGRPFVLTNLLSTHDYQLPSSITGHWPWPLTSNGASARLTGPTTISWSIPDRFSGTVLGESRPQGLVVMWGVR